MYSPDFSVISNKSVVSQNDEKEKEEHLCGHSERLAMMTAAYELSKQKDEGCNLADLCHQEFACLQ